MQPIPEEEVLSVHDNRGYTIDDALDCIGFGAFQAALLLMSGVGFFATTVELILMSLIQGPLIAEWKVTNQKLSLLQACVFAGELLGGVFWGSLSDRIGRRLTFIGTAALATVFGLLSAGALNFNMFLLSRFGLGIAIGGSLAIDFIYFVEFVPAGKRGIRTTFIILLGIFAFFYVALIGHFVLPLSWRWFVFAAGAPNAILLVGRLFWKWESPRFLLGRGKLSEATRVLEAMARKNQRPLPPGQLISLTSLRPQQRPWYAPYSDIIGAGLLAPVLTMSMLFFGQTFGYYGLVNWIKKLMVARGITDLSPCMFFTIIGIAELPGLLLTTIMIEKKGRRLVFLMNFFGSAISALCLVFVQGRTSFIAVSGLTFFFIVGSWTALYVTTPELFPTTVRASAFTVAHSSGKLAGLLSPLIFGALWDRGVPPVWILIIIASSFVLAAMTAAGLLIETAGKRLEDGLSPTPLEKS